MPQHTVQLGDAFLAFKDEIAALTFATSGENVFPYVEFSADIDPNVPMIYPAAIIRVGSGAPDDDNDGKKWRYEVTVEIRQASPVKDGSGDMIGRTRSTDEAIGAGLFDLMARLAGDLDHVNVADDSEIQDYFHCTGCGDFGRENGYARVHVFYEALLRIN